MLTDLLNSPTDGNGTVNTTVPNRNRMVNTPAATQSLYGPDVVTPFATPNANRSMQPSQPVNDCNCNKPAPVVKVTNATQQAFNYYNKMKNNG